ncbi:MAG: hypothetical protein J0H80_01770, partial [Rhizobiales bacterium]|nr:hypothetical protein [Hyphomicrobiales bacterium]
SDVCTIAAIPDFVQCNMGMDDMRALHVLNRVADRPFHGQIYHGFLYFRLILAVGGAVSSVSR